ncbi:MAG: hypothetical protein E7606_01515 [Ruminococcaceae bacterium]|nr:hypothetical protein [Oscillospiraceae bacterium]
MPLEYQKLRASLCGRAALLAVLTFTVCAVLARLEFILMSDILLADSIGTQLLAFAQTLCIVLGFALFYCFTAILMQEIGLSKTVPFALTAVLLTLYRTVLALGGKYFIDGVNGDEFFSYELPTSALSFALEILQYLLVMLLIWLAQRRRCSLHRSLFFASLAVMGINVGSRILLDIQIGAPTSLEEIWQMVIAYASDILIYGVLLLFAMRLLAKWVYNKFKF